MFKRWGAGWGESKAFRPMLKKTALFLYEGFPKSRNQKHFVKPSKTTFLILPARGYPPLQTVCKDDHGKVLLDK